MAVAGAQTAQDLIARADDLLVVGDPVAARGLAEQARDEVLQARAWHLVPVAASTLGWAAAQSGDVALAEASFLTAGEFRRGLARADVHLDGTPGIRWGAFLVRTGRLDDARDLLERVVRRAAEEQASLTAARANVELAALDLELDLPEMAYAVLREAAGVLDAQGRPSHVLRARHVVAHALTALGRHADALSVANDAVRLASALELLTPVAEGFAVRSRVLLAADGDSQRARADAREALRLGRLHHLAWVELDALLANAAIDRLEEQRAGVAPSRPLPGSHVAQAGYLRQRFNAGWSDPHPLQTVVKRVGR